MPSDIFHSSSKFNSISNLEIVIYDNDIPLDSNCELFKSFSNLKCLKLYSANITDEFFNKVSRHIPILRSIWVESENLFTDQAMNLLAKLKILKKLVIMQHRVANVLITDIGVCQLIDSCTHIELIRFRSRPKITNTTIDHLIAIALQRNRKVIKFDCYLAESRDELQFEHQIDINSLNNLPNNLKIIIRKKSGL